MVNLYHSFNQLLLTHSLLLSITITNEIIVLFCLLFALILLLFVVSGAETAFFSLTSKDINLLKTKQEKAYKRIVQLLENPLLLHTSLTIIIFFISISIILISNWIINQCISQEDFFWIVFVIKIFSISFILLLFGQIIPKLMAIQNSIRFSKDFGIIIQCLHTVTKGVSKWLVKNAVSVEKKITKKRANDFTLEELDETIHFNNKNASEKEKNILKGIVKFSNITVKQIMHTRMDVWGIEYTLSFADVKKQIEKLHYSRLPVYKTTLDDIVGIIHTKDLLPYINKELHNWHEQIRTPFFVHEQKFIDDLLKEFQAGHVHFAIVVDEFGGTSGIVTLEDIMEEIIGEINDEFDDEENVSKKIDDHTYIFSGKTTINDLCKHMNISLHTFDEVKANNESLAGLILELNGDIPAINQVLLYSNFEFIILSIEKNRIDTIQITIKHPEVKK